MIAVTFVSCLMIGASFAVLGTALAAWLTAWACGRECDRDEAGADDTRRAYDATVGGGA